MAVIPGTSNNDILIGTAGNDVMNNDIVNNLIGSVGNDSVFGNGGDDVLNGGDGNDRLNGGLGNDTLNGGAGTDTADYSSGTINGQVFTGATAGVAVNLTLAIAQDTGGAGTDSLISIENLTGTNFNDILTGHAGNNVLTGLGGDDRLFGLDGNDLLNGGSGNDFLDGGNGNDTASYSGVAAGVAVFLFTTANQGTGAGGFDSLVNIENLTGSNFSDTLAGNDGDNVLQGLAGDDMLDGRGGVDTASYSGATAGVTVNLSLVGAQNTVGAGTDSLFDFENLTGSIFNDILMGDVSNNVLAGLAGSDQLNGGDGNDQLKGGDGTDVLSGGNGADILDGEGGADTMIGGFGDDLYRVDNIDDIVSDRDITGINVFISGGIDTVESSLTYTLGGTIENLTLTGIAALNGTGNVRNNIIKGNSANNVLDGGAGADTMIGGDGNDSYIVDNVLDGVVESSTGGVDTVQSSVTYTLSLGTENLTLTGAAVSNGTGNVQNNVIMGNSASNVLSGMDGNDRLTGGSGADTLTGGAGNDTLSYNAVSDSPAGVGKDVITDFVGAGSGVGDQLSLSAIDANELVADNQAFTYIGTAAFSAAGQVRYAGGVLQASTDGDTLPEFEIQLLGAPALFVNPASTGTDILL